MLVVNINSTYAIWNWVEWEGIITDEYSNTITGALVELKSGSTVLKSDTTDSNGYYYIKKYVSTTDYLTLKVSKDNHTIESQHVLARSLGEPWEYDLTLYYVEKIAVVVGIEDYSNTSDLFFCENDAEDWYDELTSSSSFDFHHVEMYQDSTEDYDGRASESAVKDALTDMVSSANEGDILAFIFAGHGKEFNATSHALEMWDAYGGSQGEDGFLYDTELTAIFDDSLAERVFLFFDCCFGSQFYYDINSMSNKDQFFLSGADQQDDVYVDEDNENGCWTQCFLNEAWIDEYNRSTTTEFDYIVDEGVDCYDDHEGDLDKLYDINQHPTGINFKGTVFCLSKYGITSPNA